MPKLNISYNKEEEPKFWYASSLIFYLRFNKNFLQVGKGKEQSSIEKIHNNLIRVIPIHRSKSENELKQSPGADRTRFKRSTKKIRLRI